jgi:hypothetical protein
MLRTMNFFAEIGRRLFCGKGKRHILIFQKFLLGLHFQCRRQLMRKVIVICVAVFWMLQLQLAFCSLLPKSAVTVFLLDTTTSMHLFDASRRAWGSVIQQAKGGDVIVFACVKGDSGGGSGGEFSYLKKWTIPSYSILVPNDQYRAEKNRVMNEMTEAFDKALQQKRPEKTLIFSSLRSISKYFDNHSGPCILVLASDGLEDSEIAQFKTQVVTKEVKDKIIAEEHTNGLNGYLRGVSVYMIIGGLPSEKKSLEMENFWPSYFRASGGDIPRHHYAGEFIDFQR